MLLAEKMRRVLGEDLTERLFRINVNVTFGGPSLVRLESERGFTYVIRLEPSCGKIARGTVLRAILSTKTSASRGINVDDIVEAIEITPGRWVPCQ